MQIGILVCAKAATFETCPQLRPHGLAKFIVVAA
jgi:hypothetical protein